MSFLDRHAARTDRYLDALLGADAAAGDVPADARTDPEIRRAARALRKGLVRIHPSFRFEERLAAELALSARGDEPRIAAGPGAIVSIARRPAGAPAGVPLVSFVVPAGAVRPIVVGGALSLAGAALFAWRHSRGPAHGQARWPAATLRGLPPLPGIRGGTA